MTQIKLTVFEDAERWIKKYVPLMEVDSISSVQRNSRFNPNGLTKYYDVEENLVKSCTVQDHVEALELLCQEIAQGRLFVGGVKSPFHLLDAGNWDIEVVDAYFQLVFHKKVIYG